MWALLHIHIAHLFAINYELNNVVVFFLSMRESRTVTTHVTLHSSDPKVSKFSSSHYHTFGLLLGHLMRVDYQLKKYV